MRDSKNLAVPVDLLLSPPSAHAGRFGRRTLAAIEAVGAAASLAWECLRALRYPRIYLPLTYAQPGLWYREDEMRRRAIRFKPLARECARNATILVATHVDEAAVGARALVRDLHARPERYIRVSLF
jgi:hypothetical protein